MKLAVECKTLHSVIVRAEKLSSFPQLTTAANLLPAPLFVAAKDSP